MNRMMRRSGLVWGLLTAVGCGGVEGSPAPETQAVESLKTERQAATSGSWTVTSPMQTGRAMTGAALLDSGLVLVMGGTSTFPFALSELYNPYTNTWQTTGNLVFPRYNFSTVKLASGKILVSGGWDFYYMLSGSETYDPATGSWSYAGSLSKRRNGHQSTLLQSGKVLVTGGEVEYRDGPDVHFDPATTAELYDPETSKWSSAGDLGFGTTGSIPVLLYSGEVMLLSGSRVDLYNPATNSWRANGSTPAYIPRGATATRLYSGEVMVVGGNYSDTRTFLYNPYSNQWREGPPTLQMHSAHTATLLYSGKLLIAGHGSTEIFDPGTNTWSQRDSSPLECTECTPVLLHTGSVMLAGSKGYIPPNTMAIFTP